MTPSTRARLVLRATCAAAVAALATLTAVVAQDRDTLFTRVTAEGNTVALKWDKDHPWDKQLASSGAELFAEYRSATRGVVAESLGRAASKGGDREFRFTLPDAVRSIPASQICLYIQPVGNRALLPVRRANQQGTDTARFRYEPWERVIRARADAAAAEARLGTARTEADVAARRVQAQEAALAKRGWTAPNACQNITVSASQTPPRPYDVVNPNQQDEMARRVCVHRVWHGRQVTQKFLENLREQLAQPEAAKNPARAKARLEATYGDAFILPEAAGPLLDQLRKMVGADDAALRPRMAQATEFLRDWNRLSATIATYEPHLGTATDVLPWPPTVAAVALRVLGPGLAAQLSAEWAIQGEPQATVRDFAGVIGASLDAYTDCVKDGTRQLAVKYTAWDALQKQMASGARERELAQFLTRECQQETGTRDTLKAASDSLQGEVARLQAAQTQLASAAAPLPQRAQVLNQVACGTQ
jgi:hypothetical protein